MLILYCYLVLYSMYYYLYLSFMPSYIIPMSLLLDSLHNFHHLLLISLLRFHNSSFMLPLTHLMSSSLYLVLCYSMSLYYLHMYSFHYSHLLPSNLLRMFTAYSSSLSMSYSLHLIHLYMSLMVFIHNLLMNISHISMFLLMYRFH